MVNMTHDGHHGRSQSNIFRSFFFILFDYCFIKERYNFNIGIILSRQNLGCFRVNHLINSSHDTKTHEFCYDFTCFNIELFREFSYRNVFCNTYLVRRYSFFLYSGGRGFLLYGKFLFLLFFFIFTPVVSVFGRFFLLLCAVLRFYRLTGNIFFIGSWFISGFTFKSIIRRFLYFSSRFSSSFSSSRSYGFFSNFLFFCFSCGYSSFIFFCLDGLWPGFVFFFIIFRLFIAAFLVLYLL